MFFQALGEFRFAVAQFHGIKVLRRIFRNALGDFAFEVDYCLPLFGAQRMLQQPQAGATHVVHGFSKALGRALCRRRGIIQFVGQPRGKLSQRHQLFALGFLPGGLADAVGH